MLKFTYTHLVCTQEEQRIDKVHAIEAKRNCDTIQGALQMLEGNIHNMFSDIQALKDGKYHQAEQLYRRYVASPQVNFLVTIL